MSLYKDWMKEAFITVNQVFPHDDRKGFDTAATLIPVDSLHTPARELLPKEKEFTKYAGEHTLVKLFTSSTPESHILIADQLWQLEQKITEARSKVADAKGGLKR